MDDLRRELAALKARVRLMTVSFVGLLTVVVMAGGGADAVAGALVGPGWSVSTRNAAGTQTLERLTVTSDENIARIQVKDANIELASQTTAPASPAAGTLWYDSASNTLKYWNGSSWVQPGGLSTAETVYTGAEFASVSSVFEDVPGAVLTFSQASAGSGVCVVQGTYRITGALSGGHPQIRIGINLDGVDYVMGECETHAGDAALIDSVPFTFMLPVTSLSAGNHTIKLRILRTGGTGSSVRIQNTVNSPTRVMVIH